jgi:hypothetical protein
MDDSYPMPGGHRRCIGCTSITFRNRDDQLCPKCAFETERLVEQVELAMLDDDLALLVRLDAWCASRGSSALAMLGRPSS